MNFVQHGCLIGFVDDGRVEAVYCAFGGEPHVTGKILLEQYDSDDKAREIVGGGSMLSLATRAKGTFYDTMTFTPTVTGTLTATCTSGGLAGCPGVGTAILRGCPRCLPWPRWGQSAGRALRGSRYSGPLPSATGRSDRSSKSPSGTAGT